MTILVLNIFVYLLNFGLTPFIIHKMACYKNERRGYIYPYVIISIQYIISLLIISRISAYITFTAFPTYVDSWLNFRNIAIQWFFQIVFTIFSILISTMLIIYIYDLGLKRAIIISILVYAVGTLGCSFVSRILSIIFSIITTGSMSYGPI